MAEAFSCRLKKYVVAETDDKAAEDESLDADYIVDEKARTATLTARGIAKAEEFFHLENLSDPENSTIAHHINQAIKAHGTMKRDVDYVVKDGEIIIVDEFTGRLMFGRRYSEGLHQAIEPRSTSPSSGRARPCYHHVPELLPPVQQALRHDRYGHDRGGGVCHHL